jgi:hypothetical protein
MDLLADFSVRRKRGEAVSIVTMEWGIENDIVLSNETCKCSWHRSGNNCIWGKNKAVISPLIPARGGEDIFWLFSDSFFKLLK